MPATLSGTVLAFDGAGYFTRENDRTNAVRVDLYKDSGEGKYALVQTPLPLARAVGTLAAAFVGHVANENWHFDDQGLMAERHASINDLPITEAERLFHWPQGRRPDDHPGLSDLGL